MMDVSHRDEWLKGGVRAIASMLKQSSFNRGNDQERV